jgi:NADH-quinone oxidoreductase subunit A
MEEYQLSAWGEVLLFIIVGILFVSMALLVSRLIRPNRPGVEKQTPYESGEQPVGTPWIQINTRFYIIAIVFLLFEVEVIFLFPWSVVFANKTLIAETNGAWGWFSLIEMGIFIGLLALGLAYAWAEGHLDWVKPAPEITTFSSPVPKSLYDKINERYKK